MPRKRNRKTFLINKQKKLIASRLMQLSLKVDDYVYKHKPISVKSAIMFTKEVNGYKDKCYGDKATLQVIEKLARCMKGIIKEQEESHSSTADDVTLVDVDNIPLTSINDNLTLLNQEIEMNNVSVSTENKIQLIDLDNDRSDIKNNLNDKGNEIIELSNKETGKNCDGHLKYNLQRAISNISIRGEVDPLSIEPVNTGDCSQSILNNFEISNNLDTGKGGSINRIVEDIQPATVTKELRTARAVTDVTPTPVILTGSRIKRSNFPKTNNISIPPNITALNTKNNHETNKNDSKERVQKKRARRATLECDKDKETQSKSAHVKKNKKNIETVGQNDITKTNEIKQNIEKLFQGNVENKANEPDRNTIWNNNSNQTAVAETQSNKKLFNDIPTLNPIYNNYVENDLSWIENIRYVREITQEENIPAYFHDGFWENHNLPNYWNNDDFLYT